MIHRARALWPMLLGLIAHANALANPFVYDDRTTIVNNESLRSWPRLAPILTFDPKRPLVNLSYALDYALFGLRPVGYHLFNLGLHIINIGLVFRLAGVALRDAGADEERARAAQLFAASLFAVHPLLTESVGYTSARSGLLCATFALGALLAMRRGLVERRRRSLVAALALMIAGALCKETAAMLPFAFLAYDRLLLAGGDAGERRRRLLRVHLPLVALVLVLGGVRLVTFARLELSSIRPLPSHVYTQLPVVWRYVALFVAPVGLSLAHSVREIHSALDPIALVSAAALAGAGVLLHRARRVAPVEAFGAAWFALLLAPSSLIPLAEQMSEHRVYEASAGLLLAAAAAASRLPAHRLVRAAGLAIVVVFASRSIDRNRDWAHPIDLWRKAAAVAPDLWTAHYALANEYQYDNRCEEALPEYAASIKLKATQRAVVNTGVCLAQLGRYDDADRVLRTALRLGPAIDPRFNLGLLAIARDRPEEARDHFLAVLSLDERNLPARKALVDLYQTRLADPAAAERRCREIAALAPWTPGLEGCLGAR